MTDTTNEIFFESKYREKSDPWSFASSGYELMRYERILSALGADRFNLAYEPGCSVGVLTERLAARCGRVEACDISVTAVKQARQRCQKMTNVHVHHSAVSGFVPCNADLYVFSEVGYYVTREALDEMLHTHCDALREGAKLVACHWRGESADHVLSGDDVHEVLHSLNGLEHEFGETHQEFRLDRWAKRGASV